MSKILETTRSAEKGSNIYHAIEEIAKKLHEEDPTKSDKWNWFRAQKKLNRYFLEEKLSNLLFEKYDGEKPIDECLDEARIKIDNSNIKSLEAEIELGISPEKILECNLKYYSNYYSIHRQRGKTTYEESINQFNDWQKSLDCVAKNIAMY